MRASNLLLPAILTFISCGKPSSTEHEHNGGDSVSSNQALYDQVMDIHDEVMPKTQDIYRLKKKLQDQIAATPGLIVEERQKLEKRIANLDSVAQLMLKWMHNFKGTRPGGPGISPLPDTASQEAVREYLESEMEKIRKVREAMLEAIEREKGSN